MTNIQRSVKETETVTLTFRCHPEWKRRALSAMALRGERIQDACVESLCKHLKIAPPKEGAAA